MLLTCGSIHKRQKGKGMDTNILISVIITAYNVEEWISRCLDSILTQTYRDLDIIVIDDGSSDETPAILDNYKNKDGRIRIIHQANTGLVRARERGILEARGAYIGFVDGDDEIIPEMYERLIQNAVKYNAQISQCGILYCFYDGRKKPVYGTNELKVYDRLNGCKALLQGTEMEPSLCNKIYLASLLQDSCLDKDVVNNEDMLRNIVLFNRAERSVMDDFCGYLYWRREESMSNNKRAIEIGNNILKARQLIMDYVPDDLEIEAKNNYVLGAVSVYNSLVEIPGKNAGELKHKCRSIIRKYWIKKEFGRGTEIRLWLIANAPFVYKYINIIYDFKRKLNIHSKVRKLEHMKNRL